MTRLPTKINPELARLLESQLDQQESLIWSGQPDPARSAKQKMPEFHDEQHSEQVTGMKHLKAAFR